MQETVSFLIHLARLGVEASCFAPDIPQCDPPARKESCSLLINTLRRCGLRPEHAGAVLPRAQSTNRCGRGQRNTGPDVAGVPSQELLSSHKNRVLC